MAKKKEYLFDIIPRWIRYSGLPTEINCKYGGQAWNIFSCLVSLDCRFNLDYPGWFDQSYEEISDLTGISRRTVSDYIKKFQKDGLISLVRGKFKGHKSSFRISGHIDTPKSPNSIKAADGGFLARKGKPPNLIYYQRGSGTYALESDREGENKVLKGYERVPLLPNNKTDNKKIIRSKGESFKQKQVVSPPSSQRGEETHLPNEIKMRERSSQILREINRRRKLKLAQEEREEQEELMLRLNGPEAERKSEQPGR